MFDLFLAILVVAGVVYLVRLWIDYRDNKSGGGRKGGDQKRR